MKIHRYASLLVVSLLTVIKLFPAAKADHIKENPPFVYAAMIHLVQREITPSNTNSRIKELSSVGIWEMPELRYLGCKPFYNTTMAMVEMHGFKCNGREYLVINAHKYKEVQSTDIPRSDRVILRDYIQQLYAKPRSSYETQRVLGGLLGDGLGGQYASQIVAAKQDYFVEKEAGVCTLGAAGIAADDNQYHCKLSSAWQEGDNEFYIQVPEKSVDHGEPYLAGASKELTPFIESFIERKRFGGAMIPWSAFGQ